MTNETSPEASRRGTTRKVVTSLVLAWLLLPAFFLVTGGSLVWWEAWVYCAIVLVPMTLFVLRTLPRDPAFLERRLTMREKERTQRRLVTWSMPAFVALMLVPGLDRRFGWSAVPAAAAADALVLAGYLGVLWVFSVNPWAGRTIDTIPGQQVVTTGPYAIVRHPQYASSSQVYLATPIALGSWWGLIPAALCVAVLVVRIGNEEAVLLRELPGYAEYRAKVRYRLIPGIW
jgi:protein-S-isoprenylcysteine O-methyltransferase Ste14